VGETKRERESERASERERESESELFAVEKSGTRGST
jgi:hypothetical protein